jgi:glycosyltransferase involved in cell wall biosynthesis
VFFFPTHYPSEASPIVLMEALGSGLPVVTTRWNGIPALMKGCPTATLLPVKSPAEYAGALLALAAQSETLDEVSRQSRKFYRDHFLPECFVERVNVAFHQVAPVQARKTTEAPLRVSVYLADQNPGYDRSLGISRMSRVVLREMKKRANISLQVITSLSSQQGPLSASHVKTLPWSTRPRIMRLLTDHLHPVLSWFTPSPDIWYFPKGYLPRFNLLKAPTVVTVHDTIIQYYQDHHAGWRTPMEYAYWKYMLTFTLKNADAIFTVSEISKKNIRSFMLRQGLPEKKILVTYEPCFYEQTPQPEDSPKKDYVVHLASREPHKSTHNLIRWWIARSESGENPPLLSLVGQVPSESEELIATHPCIKRHGFLDDDELQTVIREARALILPSEIEGFGLPAIEAYYLGTPVCFVKGTSVEEILEESTSVGAFQLAEQDSLWDALDQVLAMPAAEVRRIGLELRERFAAAKVVDRMIEGFRSVAVSSGSK